MHQGDDLIDCSWYGNGTQEFGDLRPRPRVVTEFAASAVSMTRQAGGQAQAHRPERIFQDCATRSSTAPDSETIGQTLRTRTKEPRNFRTPVARAQAETV
ncbi:MAG: hypothetical protein M1358_14660 [Chloroflexi bacterium]|nr:hypothetical protein [Chloroflexota bacterium]